MQSMITVEIRARSPAPDLNIRKRSPMRWQRDRHNGSRWLRALRNG